ncbi:50S ribosomal protein L30 [Bacillus pumilus]|uniref:50S ribosomal protein L30 n=1 Tax=Bacillus pumilus TaxID=1408 RepID=UPI0011A1AFC2|nr:50S ribosomal protein L30 [Bacillus pumilus]
MGNKLEIRVKRSVMGGGEDEGVSVGSVGVKKRKERVVDEENGGMGGMIKKVCDLVCVKEE